MKPLRWLSSFRRKAALENFAPQNSVLELDSITRGTHLLNTPRELTREAAFLSSATTLSSVSGVRALPKPAIKWVGAAGRTALREFDFATDSDAVCSWQAETYTLNFADFRHTDSFAAAFRHDLRRAALDPHHGIFVLDEGELVGFLWLVICENTWTRERYGYVNNLYISSARRKGGLARELMDFSDVWFRRHRIKRARLTVTVANKDACNLYERCGYDIARWEMEKDL